jgi:membrane-associated phospholipid phosphatase
MFHQLIIFTLELIMLSLLIGNSDAPAYDSTRTKKSIWNKLTDDAAIFAGDGGAFFISPLHFSGKDWLYAAGVLGVSGLSMIPDKEIKKQAGRNTTGTYNNDFWDIPTAYGFVQYPSIFAGTIYAAGLISNNDDVRITGRLLLESLAYSGITVMLARYAFGRYRPYYSDDPWKYTWFQPKNDTQSFPSGHVTVAFATSTVLAERIDAWWARIGFYGLAALTAYTRILNNQHWFSDVVVGGLLGFGAGYFVINREEIREKSSQRGKKGGRLSIFPSFNGINFVYGFP